MPTYLDDNGNPIKEQPSAPATPVYLDDNGDPVASKATPYAQATTPAAPSIRDRASAYLKSRGTTATAVKAEAAAPSADASSDSFATGEGGIAGSAPANIGAGIVEGITNAPTNAMIAGGQNITTPTPVIGEKDILAYIKKARAMKPSERRAAGITPQDLSDPPIEKVAMDKGVDLRAIEAQQMKEYRAGASELANVNREEAVKLGGDPNSAGYKVGAFGGQLAGSIPLLMLQPNVEAPEFVGGLIAKVGKPFARRILTEVAHQVPNIGMDVVAGAVMNFLQSGEGVNLETLPRSALTATAFRGIMRLLHLGAGGAAAADPATGEPFAPKAATNATVPASVQPEPSVAPVADSGTPTATDTHVTDEMRAAQDRRVQETTSPEDRRVAARRQEVANEIGLAPDHPAVTRIVDHETQLAAKDVDQLTGLQNRDAYQRAVKSGAKPPAVSEIDLAGIGAINQKFSETHADAVIAAAGRKVSELVGDAGTAFRKGGDEIVIHWNDPKVGQEMHAQIADKMANAEVQVVGEDGQPTDSWVGVDHYSGFGHTFEDASKSLYASKPKPGEPGYKSLPSGLADRIAGKGNDPGVLPGGFGVRGSESAATGQPGQEVTPGGFVRLYRGEPVDPNVDLPSSDLTSVRDSDPASRAKVRGSWYTKSREQAIGYKDAIERNGHDAQIRTVDIPAERALDYVAAKNPDAALHATDLEKDHFLPPEARAGSSVERLPQGDLERTTSAMERHVEDLLSRADNEKDPAKAKEFEDAAYKASNDLESLYRQRDSRVADAPIPQDHPALVDDVAARRQAQAEAAANGEDVPRNIGPKPGAEATGETAQNPGLKAAPTEAPVQGPSNQLNLKPGAPLPTGRHQFPMTFPADAGVEALRTLKGQGVIDEALKMSPRELQRSLEAAGVKGLPDATAAKYLGKSYEAKRDLLSAYGKFVAKDAGHDSLFLPNTLNPAAPEVVDLSGPLVDEGVSGLPSRQTGQLAESERGGAGAPPDGPPPGKGTRAGLPGGDVPGGRPALPWHFDMEQWAAEQTANREAARGEGTGPTFKSIVGQAKAAMIDSFSPIEDAFRDAIRGNGGNVPRQQPHAIAESLLGDAFPLLPGRTGGGKPLPSEDITNAIDSSILADEVTGQMLKDSGVLQAVKDAPNSDVLEQTMIARHAIQVFYQKWGRFIDKMAPDRRAKLEQIYQRRFGQGRNLMDDATAAKNAEGTVYHELGKTISAASHKLLDVMVDGGLIPHDTAEMLKKLYPDYVPLQRVFSVLEETDPFGGGGPASISKQTVLRKLNGSSREIESPVASLLDKAYAAHSQAARNKAARLLASYREWDGNPLQIRELKDGEWVPADRTFSFVDGWESGGKTRRFATKPEIASAAKALDVVHLNEIQRWAALPGRALKVGATGLNPVFFLKNTPRDLQTALTNLRYLDPYKPADLAAFGASLRRGIFEAANHGDLYDEAARNAAMFTSFDALRNPDRETIASIRGERASTPVKNKATGDVTYVPESRIKYAVRTAGQMFRAVEDIAGRSEQVMRLTVYDYTKRKLVGEGMPESEAILAAKQAALWTTGPFHRQGNYGRTLRAMAPYLNASIQGQRVTVSSLRNQPVLTATRMAIASLLPVAMATAWNLSDPKRKEAYDQIAEFEKANSIVVLPTDPSQDETGMWKASIKIPLEQSGVAEATAIRRVMEAAHGLDPVRFGEVSSWLLGAVSPISTANELGSVALPQPIKPLVEVHYNKDFFSDREVESSYIKNDAKDERIKPDTSGTIAFLSKATAYDPIELQHLVRGYTAGGGMQVVNGVDHVAAALGLIPPEQLGGESTYHGIRRAFRRAVPMSQRQQEERDAKRAE